jgi:hypothetical protein
MFDTIPDKSNITKIFTIHGHNTRRNFFSNPFGFAKCALSRADLSSMDIGPL